VSIGLTVGGQCLALALPYSMCLKILILRFAQNDKGILSW